MIMGMFR